MDLKGFGRQLNEHPGSGKTKALIFKGRFDMNILKEERPK